MPGSTSPKTKIAVVTGGNKGVGFALCRRLAGEGCTTLLTARDERKGKAACAKLEKEGLSVRFHPLDVREEASARALAGFIEAEFGRLDILVNNAAILNDRSKGALTIDMPSLRETLDTNLYGPLRVAQALIPLLKKSGSGRIVNVSSWFGSLAEMQGGGYAGYRISKACLNALTRILADELKGAGVLVNAACPGWVRTDMGGSAGPLSPDEGADTPAWLALLPDGGPTGSFFQGRKAYAW
jgi:NAD(P)-dependent dehydrogenase (short-subunit alcohol dehydrogenase family)